MFEDPANIRLKNNAVFYKDIMSQNEMKGVVELPELKNVRPADDYRATEEFVTYERLCRGEETMVSATKWTHFLKFCNIKCLLC